MPNRPLQAVLGLDGARLADLLSAAMSGGGPALLPIAADAPRPHVRALLRAMRPATLRTADGVTPLDGAAGVAEDTALLIATSGSTGEPKGVELSAAALRHSTRASTHRIGAGPGDAWLCVLPTSYIAGLQVVLRALSGGAEPLYRRFDPAEVMAAAAEHRPHVSLVPTQLRRLLASGADLSLFRTILLGGAAADERLLAAARAAGGRVVTTYGMSETCGGCVYDGVPLDGVAVRLADDGRVLLSGPVLFSGYRLRPELSAEHLVDEGGRTWFRTGDLGRLADGRLTVRGRVDDVINTGGHKVVAGEVAALLARLDAVADAAVVGRPDPEWGERVTAVVVPADPAAPPTLPELRSWVAEHLPRYAAPRELELRAALPLLASGKPDLRALRQAAGPQAGPRE
ncbi:AMP-binding protein [Marinitenerispora sediminis]|uniref:AMP-dependent synthetase n=1 Tax=Marinitenerispora sediminis TaxID=1931232 RepID=A0A368T316_9ACTN|nr:AMP-binding protein [Marinitenerispora sediminis]RCV50253.1 AMP-dependent synthetase [Marinitenerispora sediminis]RCV56316.1 AMP-dependent synthetase [Marinitenerispora sediminis]RCV56508.1 AMP-dependent synthetase [Marinitenerispora sediminis]